MILQKIEHEIKDVNGLNMIQIRGYPSVGKLALAGSMAIWPEDEKWYVILFRFDSILEGML